MLLSGDFFKKILCMLGNFFFFKINFFKKFFQEHYQSVNLGPNCLQRSDQQTTKVAASKVRVIKADSLFMFVVR